ncbi:IclR family transcriptional regulator domain-containing protein [Streptomyces sp. AK08-02]|uniref:IclR family transcriptional regulator domain-containing protein n=1 Tax=Streptomyces sp. AK08-02 TaxID=3028654 RepID=UPI0029A1350C|nr:IclR family transcriptional regulator C-terminal domain-containing protein [Streptomyces sp. AK08-02]MDX3750656.1 IclR family transcriptional regulator C-terminal domain-containing protein [Streptomyces sp. AK08-02]
MVAPATNVPPVLDGPVPAEAVAPLMRGIAVLRQLTEAGGTLSLSGLERATGLARSTVDRITATLARMGYVRLDGRDAVLTPRLMELGNAYLAALRLPALLDAHADALADELDESVSLAVGDRDGIRFIHQATRRRAMSLSFRIGDLLPAERTAPGPLFATEWTAADWRRWHERRAADPADLGFPAIPPRPADSGDSGADFEAYVERARADGWALDDQLIEPGLVAVSVPVRDPRTGRVACVASVVSHTSRRTVTGLRDDLLPRLRSTVTAMEAELRVRPADGAPASPSGLAAWTGASKQELGREFVESLARGLTVLTAFGESRAELTLTEVARATGLARATARRALITYEHLGYVETRGRTFVLTPRVLSLGFPPLSRTSLPEIAGPHLAELAGRVQESASLAILSTDSGPGSGAGSGAEIQYTARAAARRIVSAHITVGTRVPAYPTSMGRVLLAGIPEAQRQARDLAPLAPLAPLTPHTVTDPAAFARVLTEVREQGYALVSEELEEGLRSIAVPVRDRTGRVVAAVNVAMHTTRRTAESCVTEILPELYGTASRIEGELRTAGRFTRVPLA